LFGKDLARDNTVMTSLININSPMTFDDTMMGALEIYAAHNQTCIISPFIVGGTMAPVSVMGTLTQVLAEVMAGVNATAATPAYNDLFMIVLPIRGVYIPHVLKFSAHKSFQSPLIFGRFMGFKPLVNPNGKYHNCTIFKPKTA
jgi:hypothetical protein